MSAFLKFDNNNYYISSFSSKKNKKKLDYCGQFSVGENHVTLVVNGYKGADEISIYKQKLETEMEKKTKTKDNYQLTKEDVNEIVKSTNDETKEFLSEGTIITITVINSERILVAKTEGSPLYSYSFTAKSSSFKERLLTTEEEFLKINRIVDLTLPSKTNEVDMFLIANDSVKKAVENENHLITEIFTTYLKKVCENKNYEDPEKKIKKAGKRLLVEFCSNRTRHSTFFTIICCLGEKTLEEWIKHVEVGYSYSLYEYINKKELEIEKEKSLNKIALDDFFIL